MAIVDKDTLKSYFTTGSTPTQVQFENLIDSMKSVGYASLSVDSNATATTIAASSSDWSNKAQVTVFDTNGDSAGDLTPDHTNDHITVAEDGSFQCIASVSFSGGSNDNYSLSFFKNNGGTKLPGRASRVIGSGGDVGNVCVLSGTIDLSQNDTIELWIQNESASANCTIEDCVFSVVQQ